MPVEIETLVEEEVISEEGAAKVITDRENTVVIGEEAVEDKINLVEVAIRTITEAVVEEMINEVEEEIVITIIMEVIITTRDEEARPKNIFN